MEKNVVCHSEYNNGHDTIDQGCGAKYTITADDLTAVGCLSRNNAYFGWKCVYCGRYHIDNQYLIPKYIKDEVWEREHPKKQASIVNFNNYKMRKGKK